MRFYWLVLGVLAVWRVTHLLNAEDGPWKIIARFRVSLGRGFFGDMFGCFYCLSVWVSLPFAMALGESTAEKLLLWPALSAGAILLERTAGPPPAQYWEDQPKEDDDALLRTKKPDGDGEKPESGGQH